MVFAMIRSFLILGFYFHLVFFFLSCFGKFDVKRQSFLQGWTYGLNGNLVKATRISGMRDFNGNVCISILCYVAYTIYNSHKEKGWLISLTMKGRILVLYQSK
jgi:hypothetical protein